MRLFNILLVDDEEPALIGLEQGVSWSDINIDKVFKCHSMDTAIRMIKTYSIDIVLTDIEMPNGTGLELIQWVKANAPEIKTIFYTGHAKFSYAQEALRLGASDYLLKPVPYDELESVIKRLEGEISAANEEGAELEGESSVGVSTEDVVRRVKKIISENLSEGNLQREDLASAVHLSPGYLTRIFKKETGMALTDYIIEKRIAVAKQLLEKTNLPVTTISSRVGISYSSYFTKIFKEQVGMSPVEYRQHSRGN